MPKSVGAKQNETVNIAAAKARLPELVERASSGETIVLTRNGKPKALLTPLERPLKQRRFGAGKGRWEIPDDFDAPLPDDLLDAFEGKNNL
jgi:prevent-host-death family protein